MGDGDCGCAKVPRMLCVCTCVCACVHRDLFFKAFEFHGPVKFQIIVLTENTRLPSFYFFIANIFLDSHLNCTLNESSFTSRKFYQPRCL